MIMQITIGGEGIISPPITTTNRALWRIKKEDYHENILWQYN